MRDLVTEKLASYNPQVGYGDAVVASDSPDLSRFLIGQQQTPHFLGVMEREKARRAAEKERTAQDNLEIKLDDYAYQFQKEMQQKHNDIYKDAQNIISRGGNIKNDLEFQNKLNKTNKAAQVSKDAVLNLDNTIKSVDKLPDWYDKKQYKQDILESMNGFTTDNVDQWKPPVLQPKHILTNKYITSVIPKEMQENDIEVISNENGMKKITRNKVKSKSFYTDENGKLQPGFSEDQALQLSSDDPNFYQALSDQTKAELLKPYEKELSLMTENERSKFLDHVLYSTDKNGKTVLDNAVGKKAQYLFNQHAGTQVVPTTTYHNIPQPTKSGTQKVEKEDYIFNPAFIRSSNEATGRTTAAYGINLQNKSGKSPIITSGNKFWDSTKDEWVENKDKVPINAKQVGYVFMSPTGKLFSAKDQKGNYTLESTLQWIKNTPAEELKKYKLEPALIGNITENTNVAGDTESNDTETQAKSFLEESSPIKKTNKSVIVPFKNDDDVQAALNTIYQSSTKNPNATFKIEDITLPDGSPSSAKIIKDAYDRKINKTDKPQIKSNQNIVRSNGSDVASWNKQNSYQVGDKIYFFDKSTGLWSKK